MIGLRKLAPPDGWPAAWWEIGIVTLGVFMALAAQQAVERSSSRDRAAQAEQRIELELDNNQGNEVERVAVRKCLTNRLHEFAAGLASGRSDWVPQSAQPGPGQEKPALRNLYDMPSRNWITDAYDEALAQGDLKELTADQRSGLASMYTQIKYMAKLNAEEQQLGVALAPLQFNPPLSNAERNSLIGVIARLDQVNGLMVLISRQTFRIYRDLGYTDTPQEIAEFRRSGWWEQNVADYRRRYGDCVDARAVAEIDPRLLPASR